MRRPSFEFEPMSIRRNYSIEGFVQSDNLLHDRLEFAANRSEEPADLSILLAAIRQEAGRGSQTSVRGWPSTDTR
jgi:hypothetical protein